MGNMWKNSEFYTEFGGENRIFPSAQVAHL